MLNTLASTLSKFGVTANAMTLFGFSLSFVAAYFIATGQLAVAAFVVILSGGCDLLDGKIARLQNNAGKFGALLDSSLDRYSDALYYGATVFYFFNGGEPVFAFLALSACVGAFETSYIRARAEGLGQKCQVGFWERGERTVLIIVALAAANLEVAVIYLGILTHLTALSRLLYVRRRMAGEGAECPPRSRLSVAYLTQSIFYIATVLLVRPW